MKEHIFYPMLNKTVKTLISVIDKEKYSYGVLRVLMTYPNHILATRETCDPVYMALIQELDRQYARWNKGGQNGNI